MGLTTTRMQNELCRLSWFSVYPNEFKLNIKLESIFAYDLKIIFCEKNIMLWYVKSGWPNYPSDYQLDFPPHKMYLLSQFLSELVQISHSDSVIVYLSKSSRILNIFSKVMTFYIKNKVWRSITLAKKQIWKILARFRKIHYHNICV